MIIQCLCSTLPLDDIFSTTSLSDEWYFPELEGGVATDQDDAMELLVAATVKRLTNLDGNKHISLIPPPELVCMSQKMFASIEPICHLGSSGAIPPLLWHKSMAVFAKENLHHAKELAETYGLKYIPTNLGGIFTSDIYEKNKSKFKSRRRRRRHHKIVQKYIN